VRPENGTGAEGRGESWVLEEGAATRAEQRRFSRELRAQVVLDVLTGVQSQAEVCREHTRGANLLGLWKSTFLERGHLVVANEAACSAEEARIAGLEPMLGRMTMENEVRKEPCAGRANSR
jgi:transposase